jgi:hypothetical protein
MNDFESGMMLQLLLLAGIIVLGIFFLLTQYRILELIHPENRRMPSGNVWLQLIPIFGHIYQFVVISRISDSIRNELNTPIGDSIFAEDPVPSGIRPTFIVGILYAVFMCLTLIPLTYIKSLFALAGVILWIVYWVQLARYKKKLKDRSLLLNIPQ